MPEILASDSDEFRFLEFAKFKENIIAFVTGNSINSKIKIINYKTNQVLLIFKLLFTILRKK
jgi:hypothetical protein